MNRRDRHHIEERRKDYHQRHDHRSPHSKPSNLKNRDSYLQSQQVIHSLTARPRGHEVDSDLAKGFRIPRKQSEIKETHRTRSRSPVRGHIPDHRNTRNVEPANQPTTNTDYSHRQPEEVPTRTVGYKERISWRKQRIGNEKCLKVVLADRSRPGGKIDAKNAQVLVKVLADVIKKYIFRGTSFFPKFLGHGYENGVFFVMCAAYTSCTHLKKELSSMEPPWPGAQLEVVFERYDECIVSATVPTNIHHMSEFLELCKKGNRRLATEKWRRIACEDCPGGREKVYTIGMDAVSFELIKSAGRVVRCGDKTIRIKLIEYDRKVKKRKN